jgi:hypothetical protein
MELQNFVSTININPVNYIGQASAQYLLRAFAANKTAEAGVRFLDSVKFKINLKKLDGTNLLVPATCDYSPNGTVTASATQYEVKQVQSEIQICWSDLFQLFGSDQLSAGDSNGNVNQITDFTTGFIDMMVGRIGESVDNMLWNAKAATGGTLLEEFDGYLTILKASGQTGANIPNNITGTTGTGGTITVGNVISTFGQVYAAAPAAILIKPIEELAFFCNAKTLALLRRAYSLFINISPIYDIGSTFMGIKVHAIPSIPDNVICFGQLSNFVILTDLYSDFNNVAVLDERPKWNYVVFVLRGKLCAGIGFPAEVTSWGLA